MKVISGGMSSGTRVSIAGGGAAISSLLDVSRVGRLSEEAQATTDSMTGLFVALTAPPMLEQITGNLAVTAPSTVGDLILGTVAAGTAATTNLFRLQKGTVPADVFKVGPGLQLGCAPADPQGISTRFYNSLMVFPTYVPHACAR
jgi:hypothetical protein